MVTRLPALALFAVVSIALTTSCGDGGGPTRPGSSSASTGPGAAFPSGTLVLTHSPIDPAAIVWITPLGNLNPPGHTLPTDHIYFYTANPNAGGSPQVSRGPFYAPGAGTVIWMLGGAGQESKLMVRQTSTFSYYIDHVILVPGIAVGTVLTAGQHIGTTGNSYAIDLGVINDSLTVGFLNPSRYTNSDSLHADAPLKYYTEPVRSQLYAKVQRLGPDLDGTINHDKAGTLSGNWFTQSSGSPLSFAYDTWDPEMPMISIGVGTYQGVFALQAGDPLPRTVTVASGRVLYTLYGSNNGPSKPTARTPFYMLVQMIDDTHIREELFAMRPTDFTDKALTFLR